MVHYQTMDVSECPIEELICEAEQRGFHNVCGCGCIDKGDPACTLPAEAAVNFISPDPNRCVAVSAECPLTQKPFNNRCGCGCVEE